MKLMKKVLFTILILFIASCSKEISSNRIVEIDGLAYEENSNTPYSGKAITYNGKYGPDGKIEYQVTYKNGEAIKEEYFHENGQLANVLACKENIYLGGGNCTDQYYYENGQLEYKVAYKNGESNSRQTGLRIEKEMTPAQIQKALTLAKNFKPVIEKPAEREQTPSL